jgi:hypothetical protein
MSKFIAAFFLVFFVVDAFASLPPTTLVQVEIETAKNGKIAGFIKYNTENGCMYDDVDTNRQFPYLMEYYPSERKIDLKEEGAFQSILAERGKDLTFYGRIYKLGYLDDIENNLRATHAAYAPEDKYEILLDEIAGMTVLSCGNYGIAPLVSMPREQAEKMKKRALAVWSDEVYPEGNVTIASYNKDFATVESLASLLREAVKGTKPPDGETPMGDGYPWWYGIYDRNIQDKLKASLPENVFFLTYHVQD